MKSIGRIAASVGLVVLLAFGVVLSGVMQTGCDSEGGPSSEAGAASPADSPAAPATGEPAKPADGTPRLLDLGSKECIPCKMMPVLAFAFLMAFATQHVGRAFNRLTQVEYWVRMVTGTVFILVGIYYCVTHIYGVSLLVW